jgi:hypothetical protein
MENKFNWLSYDTDKIKGHGYQKIFEDYLSRDKKIIIEFGCREGSAKLWCDYFNNGKIYGCDIVPFTFNNDRFQFVDFNMYVDEFYDKIPNQIDVIIEDGPHTPKSQMIMLDNCLKKMNDGGIIIFEDLHCTDKLEDPNYEKFKGDSDMTLNELLREWKNGIYKDYKYIKSTKFKNLNIEIIITKGELKRWEFMKTPSEVIIIKIKK